MSAERRAQWCELQAWKWRRRGLHGLADEYAKTARWHREGQAVRPTEDTARACPAKSRNQPATVPAGNKGAGGLPPPAPARRAASFLASGKYTTKKEQRKWNPATPS
jgi:hypothetical protein